MSKTYQIRALQDETLVRIRTATNSANADLLAVLFEQPYCRISNVVERCEVSRPTATNWLNALVRDGVPVDIKVCRERIFINSKFFQLLMRPESAPEPAPTLF